MKGEVLKWMLRNAEMWLTQSSEATAKLHDMAHVFRMLNFIGNVGVLL